MITQATADEILTALMALQRDVLRLIREVHKAIPMRESHEAALAKAVERLDAP